ncbi:FAD binding domain-containing protein [Syncephalis fuscata]|nr:FAD binding domain-containing protein [Syncephalis fuscata]
MSIDQESSTNQPVVIVGAGSVGLMAALVLTEIGVPVEIYERNHKQTTEWRAAGIHSRIIEMFARYGLAERLLAVGNPFNKFRYIRNGKVLEGMSIDCIRSEYPMTLGCGQDSTEALLHERLAELGIYVKWGWEYVSHESIDDNRQISIQFKKVDSDEVITRQTPYMVGCDGAHSKIRKAIGAQFNGRSSGDRVAVFDVEVDVDWLPVACFIVNSNGFVGAVCAHDNNKYRMFTGWNANSPDPTKDELVEAIKRSFLPMDFGNPRILSLSMFNINERRASQFISGDARVFICGDAAHVHSPAGGQGMNMGLQDAENIAWKIGMVYHGYAKSDLLKSYGTERIPVADDVIKLSGSLTLLLRHRWIANAFLRLQPIMRHLPKFYMRIRMETTAQLRIKYSLSDHGGIFADTPAWSKAASSWNLFNWFPFNLFSDPICMPGSRAIDCQVIDPANCTNTRTRHFYAQNNGSYKAVIFIDNRKTAADNSTVETNACQLPLDTMSQLKDVMTTFKAYKSAVLPAFVIYGTQSSNDTVGLSAQTTSLIAQLNKKFNDVPVFIDMNQGKQYDNMTMADMYQCTRLNEHAVYLIRPDTYIAARMLLHEAAITVGSHLDTIGMQK